MLQGKLCFVSNDTVVLTRGSITQSTLERGLDRLSRQYAVDAKACYLVLTIFSILVRVKFTANPAFIDRFLTEEASLTVITSINYTLSEHIETQLIYTCDTTSEDGHYCNYEYYFKLSSGELFWIFNKDYTELSMLLEPILYRQENGTTPQLNCFEEKELNALPCDKSVCFARQIDNKTNNTEINCGMPKSWSINRHIRSFVQVKIEKRLCLNGETYFEFSYTCNTNQCNEQDTIDAVSEIISQHYNISNLQLPSNLYKPEIFTSYCQTITQKSNQSMISSTFG